MFTLDTNIKKTIIIYFTISIITLVANLVYSLFSHGVSSNYMTWMFLYPLIGGVFFYFVMNCIVPNIYKYPYYRLFYNIYNSGIAALTTSSFLKGILEIAGTNSNYITIFNITSISIIIAAILILIVIIKIKKACL